MREIVAAAVWNGVDCLRHNETRATQLGAKDPLLIRCVKWRCRLKR